MVRTQIYLTEEEHSKLRSLSQRSGQRQSALIREAVDDYLARAAATPRQDRLQACRGMWQDRDLAEFSAFRAEVERRLVR